MAFESTISQNLDSRNRGEAEPRKKLRKRRSIKVSRGSYLRQSSKSSKSRFDSLPADESSATSSKQQCQQPSLVTLSDSSQNDVKFTSSFNSKKGSFQEGSKYDDMNSVVSSSHRVVCPSITMPDDAAMPRNQCSVEVSDASPESLEAANYEASPQDSESSYDSSDHSKSPHYAKTICSSQKASRTLTRSSSNRAVKILFKKNSFKLKRTGLKYCQMSEELNVERATCSSTIKDSRFPEHVELEPGQTESDRISFVEVCPYHHCSLNGHCHDPPPQKKPFLRRKRQSSIQQMSVRLSNGSEPGKKHSADNKKGVKKQAMTSNTQVIAQLLRGANAPIVNSNPIPSYPEKDNQKSVDKIRNCFTREEVIQEETFELNERTLGCYKTRTGEDKSHTPAIGVVSRGHETNTIFGDRENNITQNGDNDNEFSHTHSLNYSRMPHDRVSINGDNDSDSKSRKSNLSSITRNLLSSKMDEAKEEINSNQKPTKVLVFASTEAGDSENKEQGPIRNSEPAVSLGARKSQLGKGRNMSMWHLIHKHMASGLDAEGGTNPLQGADGGKKVEEADMITERKSSDVSPEFSDSAIGTYNQDEENQDIEIRKLYAIKLVREAIEKILLPEVQDQLCENQSITSDTVEDQELSEKNNQEDPDESCQSESLNIGGSNNKSANPRELVQVDDSTRVQEIKKSDEKLGKKSDKKSPSNWSNLKKWILLQRFTKELEKVRKLNLRKPQQQELETDPGAEKISLRRQTVDEKRRAEEWMLDYALQQVISQLAPTQKRKVALLVKAFETVVPPQEDCNVQTQDNVTFTSADSGKNLVHVEHCAQLSTNTCIKSDDLRNSSCNDEPLDESQTGERSCAIQSETCDVDGKSITSGEILPDSDENTADNVRESGVANIRKSALETSTTENLGSSSLEQQTPIVQREFRPGTLIVQMSPPLNHKENEAGQFLLDKQNYLGMWHVVCQHVVSSIATKVGIEFLGEEDEETEDANKFTASGPQKDPPKGSHNVAKEINVASHQQAEFSRSQVLKLVKEAVQEILSPEIQDDSSDTLSSEILPEKDLSEKDDSEGGKQRLTEQSTREFDRSEEGLSLNEEKETKENATTAEESKKVESLDKSNSDPPKPKNWSKLKKLIFLKRSIKAMEIARKLKSPPQQLPLSSDTEPEKVDSRHQMMGERKKAEQWMLDYAVQHIVTTLTPARKRRVAMLVEAFEAVVPLPET